MVAALTGAIFAGSWATGCGSQDPSGTSQGGPAAPPGHVLLASGAHPLARPEFDRGPLDPGKRLANLSVVFKLSPEQLAEREALKAALVDPSSPSYQKWLTPAEYAARFGVTAAHLAMTRNWLEQHGLAVHDVSPLGARVTFSGTVAQVEDLLHAEMHRYEVGGEMHYALSSAPAIPKELADVILSIRNTHDFHPRPVGENAKKSMAPIPETKIGSTVGFAPPDWANVYDVTKLYTTGVGGKIIDGTGVSIAIVGISDIAQSDIDAFRTAYGLPASTITKTLVPNTGPAGAQGGAGIEAILDVEWSGGIAKKSTINYVYTGTSDGNVDDATFYAIENNLAPILSESWGGCEYGITPADQNVVDVFGSAANLLGITYLASSGDSGAASCAGFGLYGLYVNIPATYPGVTSVGGTEFKSGSITLNASNVMTGYPTTSGAEGVWDDAANPRTSSGIAAGGGGISVVFDRPSYQKAPVAIPNCAIVGSLPVPGIDPTKMRQVPDVSFTASGASTHYPIFIQCTINAAGDDCDPAGGSPGTYGIGGTSASAPSFAGVVALMNQIAGGRLGNINPLLYTLASTAPTAFHDVTAGNNEVVCQASDPGCPAGLKYGYAATSGYDCAAGLGSVDAYNLINAMSSMAKTTTTLAANPTSTSEGTPVTLTATVKVPTPNASALGGIVTFAFESYETTDAGADQIDLSWTLGTGNVTGTTSTGTATLSAAIPPGLLRPGMQYVDVVAMFGGDAKHFPSTSTKVRLTMAPPALAITPAMATVAPGAAIQYASTGALGAVRWYIFADDTCNAQGMSCSTLDESTGAFKAGTGALGNVEVVAFDADGAEARATVVVSNNAVDAGTPPGNDAGSTGSDAGTPPAGDAGTPPAADAGTASDASAPRDAGTKPGDAGTAATDAGDVQNADNGSNSGSNGCGCKTAGTPGGSNAPLSGIAGLAIAAGLVRRRRRRA